MNISFLSNCAKLAVESYDDIGTVRVRIESDVGGYVEIVDGEDDIAYVVFRGSDELRDWLLNARMNLVPYAGGKVHAGFLAHYMSLRDNLFNELAKKRNREIIFVGHSLGAIGGIFCAVDQRLDALECRGTKIVTFGGPRVGDAAFAAAFREKVSSCTWDCIRVENAEDCIPTLPIRYHHPITRRLIMDRRGGFVFKEGGDPPKKWSFVSPLASFIPCDRRWDITAHFHNEYHRRLTFMLKN